MKAIKYLLVLSLVFSSFSTQAKIIALGAPENYEDFKEYLVNNPGFDSLSNSILEKKIKKNNQILQKKYELAVKGLTLADLKPSIFLFKEITDFPSSSFIFSDEKIKLISESFFRLSNLDRQNENYWIKQGILNDPGYKPSETTFNPVIMKKYNGEREKLYSFFYNLEIDRIKPNWARVFVNSKQIHDKLLVYPSGRYSLQIFKEGYLPYKEDLLGAEVIKIKEVKLNKYAFGTCQNPVFYEPKLKIQVDAVFYSKHCILTKKDKPTLAYNNQNLNSFNNIKMSSSFDQTQPQPKQKNRLFSDKKTWYYIVGGAIITSLAIGLSQSSNTKIKPVQHD